MPIAVVRPHTVDVVCRTLAWASEHGIPVTARGAGTGLCGGCRPRPNGIVVSFERMQQTSRSTPITMSPSSTRA
jgi:glycolate oxidase